MTYSDRPPSLSEPVVIWFVTGPLWQSERGCRDVVDCESAERAGLPWRCRIMIGAFFCFADGIKKVSLLLAQPSRDRLTSSGQNRDVHIYPEEVIIGTNYE